MAAGLADQLSFERLVSHAGACGTRFPQAGTGEAVFSLQQAVDFCAKSAKFHFPLRRTGFLYLFSVLLVVV
jgi:hypothetical protein